MEIVYNNCEDRFGLVDRQEEIQLVRLKLEHPEVKKKKVSRYIRNIQNKEAIDPLAVIYCEDDKTFYLNNGHHRVVAASLLGIESLLAEITICPHHKIGGHTHFPSEKTYSVEDRVIQ